MTSSLTTVTLRGYYVTSSISLIVTAGYAVGTPTPPGAGSGQDRQFVGEIQQLGLTPIFDSSMGVT